MGDGVPWEDDAWGVIALMLLASGLLNPVFIVTSSV